MADDAASLHVADRTLVAYERDDGFDCHHAHDAPDPATLGPEAPFGGETTRDLTGIRDRLRDLGVTVGDPRDRFTGERPDTAVDPSPVETGLSWPEVVARVDYRTYDRCLRVADDWTTTAFLALFFGFADRGGDDRDPVGDGALLAVDEGDHRVYTYGWFEGVKSTTADGLRRGLVGEATARSYLGGRVRTFAGEREVYVAGDESSPGG